MSNDLARPRGLDGSDKSTPGYAGAPDTSELETQRDAAYKGSIAEDEEQEGPGPSSFAQGMLRLSQDAYSQAQTYHMTQFLPALTRSYRAFRNKHNEDSKYLSPEYRSRSKLFRPRTRSAVRRAMAQAGQALFSTGDVVNITAQNDLDPMQVVSASIKKELINYRLSRESRRNGLDWYMNVMGAVQDAKIAGRCCAKMEWSYIERAAPVDADNDDDAGADMDADGDAGSAKPQKTVVIEDKPKITLFAPENVLISPNAHWINPAQSSNYVFLRHPMTPDDAMDFIAARAAKGLEQWYPISESELKNHVKNGNEYDTLAARSAREGGKDPHQLVSGKFGLVWLHEVFMRYGGEDWVYWMLDNTIMLSEPIPVEEAYPEQFGDRPVVIGYGSLEAHRAFPMSPVESWQPLQTEINDQSNLRIDHMKQVVAPPVKYVRGKKVDLTQIQRRGPNSLIGVENLADIETFQIPDVPQSAFVENTTLAQDFDDLAGAFNPIGTQQANRGTSETLGGMTMVANNTNTMGEFDLDVFVETFVGPVLNQIMKLEEYFESDEKLLMLVGERARLFERYGVDAITDKMLEAECVLTIKAGSAASAHPLQRIQKLGLAFKTATDVLTPFVTTGKISPPTPNVQEIVSEIFGAADYQDGGERFFIGLDQPQQPPQQGMDPHAMALQAKSQLDAAKAQVMLKKAQIDAGVKLAQIHQQGQIADQKSQDAAKDRWANLYKERMRSNAEMARALSDAGHRGAADAAAHLHERHVHSLGSLRDLFREALKPPPAAPAGGSKGSAANYQPMPNDQADTAPAMAAPAPGNGAAA